MDRKRVRRTPHRTGRVSEIIVAGHATAVVVHEPLVTVELAVGPQVTSAQVRPLVRIQAVPLLGLDAYQTSGREHLVAPHPHVAAGPFGHHQAAFDRQRARIPDHDLCCVPRISFRIRRRGRRRRCCRARHDRQCMLCISIPNGCHRWRVRRNGGCYPLGRLE